MKSQYFIDQPKAVLFYHRLTPPQQTEQLVNELCQRFMDFYVKSHPIQKMPEVLASFNPQQFATIILMTKDLNPSPNILDSIARCEGTNSVVILYPNPLLTKNKNVITATNKWELFNAVSNQWAQYNNNKSFNQGKLNNAIGVPPGLQSTDAQKMQSAPQQYGGTQMPMGPPPGMPRVQPINICILNNRNDKQYNELVGTLRSKYSSNPGIVFNQFNDMNELLSKPNPAGPQSLVILGGQDPSIMAKRMADFNRGGYHSTIFYHPTVVTDPQIRQAFRYVAQDYPTIDRIVAERLNQGMMTRQLPQIGYQANMIRSPSAPSTLVTSQVIDVREQQARHIQTMANQPQFSAYSQQAAQMMNMRGSRPIMASPNLLTSVAQGVAQMSDRPVSADNHKMRMHSTWKLQKRRCLPKMGGQPIIYALDYIDKTIRPSFVERVGTLNIRPAFHPIDQLIPQKISHKSILLAPYERRQEVLGLLQSGLKKKMTVAMYSGNLPPDRIVGHPQVELVTDDFYNIGIYLRQKGIKINPVHTIPNYIHQQITSIDVLPMRTSQVVVPVQQQINISQVGVLRQGPPIPQPLSVIHEQHTTYSNSGIGSGVRPLPPILAPSLLVTDQKHLPPVMQSNVLPLPTSTMKQQILTSALKPSSPMVHSIVNSGGPAVMMQPPIANTYMKEWEVRRNPQSNSFFINESARMMGQMNQMSQMGGPMGPLPSMQTTSINSSRLPVAMSQAGMSRNQSPAEMNFSPPQLTINKPPSPMNPNLQQPSIRQIESSTNMAFTGVGIPIGAGGNRLTFNPNSMSNLPGSNNDIMAPRITPQFNGNFNGPNQISPPRNGDGKQSQINITSNQSIIDARLDPSVRQSQNMIQSKPGSLGNIPPPTVMSNIISQSPMLSFQPNSGTRPMVQEVQAISTLSGASEYSSDPYDDTAVRFRRGKKKKKSPNNGQYGDGQPTLNSEQQLFSISQEKRQSGVLSDVSFQQSGMNQPEPALQVPSLNRMAGPVPIPQGVGGYPQPMMPPLNSPYQQNLPYQQQPQMNNFNRPNTPPPNLQMAPGSMRQIPLENPTQQGDPNWLKQSWQNQPQMPQQMNMPRQQYPEMYNIQPPGSYPMSLQNKAPWPSNQQSYPPSNMYPNQPNMLQPNTRPLPAYPLKPPDVVQDLRPGSGKFISQSNQDIPVIKITESSQVRNPYQQNYYPEPQSMKIIAQNTSPNNHPVQPASQYGRTIYGQSKILPNEYDFQPAYGTIAGRIANIYDSAVKGSSSTNYENTRSNNHINNHIRIRSSNLTGSNTNSRQFQNTQPIGQAVGMLNSRLSQDLYDVRVENGVTIYSRRSSEGKRSHSVDGSPQKVEYVRHMTSDLGNVLAPGPSIGMNNMRNSYAYRSANHRSGINYVKYQSTSEPYRGEYGSPLRIQRAQQVIHVHQQPYQKVSRARSVDLEEYTRRSPPADNYGVLYMCPRTSERIHQGLYKVCTPFDKIRMYSSNEQLKLVKWNDYGAVLIFPLDERRLPNIQERNVFFVLMNTPAKNSQQIAIRQMDELKLITSKYHRAPIISSNTHNIHDYVYQPSNQYRQSDTATAISGEYKVLLRDNLRRDVQLDAFIEPQLFDLRNIGDKMNPFVNYIIIIGQDQVEYIRPHKKQNDRFMVLAQSHHPHMSDAHLWTRDAREIQRSVSNALAYKRILNSPKSIFSNTRPRVYFSFDNPEIYEEVSSELGEYINLVKYYDFNNLLSKIKQNQDEFSIIVMSRIMSRHIPSLRNNMREGKFLIYERKGYASTVSDPDAIETPTVTAVVRTIRSLI